MKFFPVTCLAAGLLLIESSCSPSPPKVEPTPTPTPTPVPTPHPAEGATQAAIQLYPDLAKKGSTFNRVFWDYYEERKQHNPTSLISPDWPLELARHTATVIGVSAYSPTPKPIATSTPLPPVVKETPPPKTNWFDQRLREKPALDRPAYDQRIAVPYFVDAYGRRYWVDRQGARRYAVPGRPYYVDPYGQQYWIDQYGVWQYY